MVYILCWLFGCGFGFMLKVLILDFNKVKKKRINEKQG